MKEKPAKGVKGFIIRSNMDNLDLLYFRVYDPDDKRKWVDYEIAHSDLEVVIEDDTASFYDKGGHEGVLDYSSKILGKVDSDKMTH